MIGIKVLASGSRGNCTALRLGAATVLLDAGIRFSTIREALDFKNPAAALITHEHGDHARKATIHELLKRGVDVYMTGGTAEALSLPGHHRLHIIEPIVEFRAGGLWCYAKSVRHDAAEPVEFEVTDGRGESVSYITDTGEVNPRRNDLLTKVIIEANHDEGALLGSNISANLKRRIWENHLSIEQVEWFFRESELATLKEVWLIHVSKKHGDAAEFERRVQGIVAGAEVKAAW